MLKIALAGNPNSGKTTLFNILTGSTAHVGNWPGVTVDKKEGVYKKLDEHIFIVDLPGIYSLSPYTPEEVITRNYILQEKPDCVINIVDATNLERNLYLTTQIMEIDVAMVVALNMMDEVKKSGAKIDGKALEKEIGVPVVEISALKGTGIDQLMKRAYQASKEKRKGSTVLNHCALSHLINDVRIALSAKQIDNPLFHAIKLVEMDELEVEAHKDLVNVVDEFKETFNDDVFGNDFEAVVADSRYKYISQNFSKVITKSKTTGEKMTKSDKIDKVLTHRIWGIPIFLIILFAIFHLTFSEDFLYLGAMGIIPFDFVSLQGTFYEGLFGLGSINSPGVILFNFVDMSSGGIIEAIVSAMDGTAKWAVGLVSDGILGGIFAILSFLPQILVLFLFFSILEDSGYMARIAFILDRIFRKFGLSGRAFMPMIMGFGCSIPAIINTRTLADEHERTATIRVIPFFSCGAKLPILTAIAGGIVMQFGVGNADVITYSMYLLGVIVAVLSVLLMRNTTMKGDVPPFIMELPPYHAPQFRNLMLHLWDKAKHFVKKAFTIILASTIIIWFVSHFSWDWKYLSDENINNSILGGIGQLLQPLFTPLGFGSQLKEFGWVFVVAAITGLTAKENVIATLGTLAATITSGFIANEALGGIDAVTHMISATGITIPALLAFIAFNMTTIPCFAAVATAKAELPSKKKFNYTVLFWLATSYIVSSMIYIIGTWWWTSFVFAAVIAVVVVWIMQKNKYRSCPYNIKKEK
ncbi:MAG: ferrous iron transport protein B [Clostridiales bacterium]|nr:ferrous iron transport protein B [Clostridiales bacterium]